MVKAGKFYCHAEDIEPNMTVPFALDPGLTVRPRAPIRMSFRHQFASCEGHLLVLSACLWPRLKSAESICTELDNRSQHLAGCLRQLNLKPPLALPPLQFTEVADKFCQKYNTKNAGSLSIDSSKVEIKVGRCVPFCCILPENFLYSEASMCHPLSFLR
jgi:hypothetical protein